MIFKADRCNECEQKAKEKACSAFSGVVAQVLDMVNTMRVLACVTDHRYSTKFPPWSLTFETPRLHKFEAAMTRYNSELIEISVL